MRNVLIFNFIILLAACAKNDDARTDAWFPSGTMRVKFTNAVGTDPLVLNTQAYMNQNGDTFYVNNFTYYISNVRLIKTNNAVVSEAESYHLVKSSDPSSWEFDLHAIPVSGYKAITFTIGVDSARNVSGAQTGALDPVHGMFWTWSTGYIFSKFEAVSPASPTGSVAFHLAGFSGPDNALRTVTLNFPTNADVTQTHMPVLNIKADLLEYFKNPSTIKFNVTYNVTTTGPLAKTLADNYADMFSVSNVEN
jgi:hypothetical protein